MNINEAIDKLYSMHKFGVKLGLENIKKLLEFLGNPQNNFKTIHIAGSNGKGSTASFISSILIENGLRTGLYTSPHFVKFNERVRINGVMIPDEYICNFMNELNDYIDENKPTFFEITTALAFKYFSDLKVDIAVIETGLGGRLDATNTINPLAAVITTIAYEHTNILGNSLKQIAYEKAGIIKANVPTFIGVMGNEAHEEIEKIAKERRSQLYKLENYIDVYEDSIFLKMNNSIFEINELPLKGRHQLYNAALAVLTVVNLFGEISSIEINKGLKNVVKNSGLSGRFEIFNNKPKVIFDAAHNEEGVKIFIDEFRKQEKNYKEKILIFGAMSDKNLLGMVDKLKDHFDRFCFTSIDYERAASIDTLIGIANKIGITAEELDDPAEFIANFIRKESENCLCVLGSIYILGEIKDKLSKYA